MTVASGFDAAVGDELGGCFVTPACYAHMTHMLMTLANGKVAVCLEVSSLVIYLVLSALTGVIGWLQFPIYLKIIPCSHQDSHGRSSRPALFDNPIRRCNIGCETSDDDPVQVLELHVSQGPTGRRGLD